MRNNGVVAVLAVAAVAVVYLRVVQPLMQDDVVFEDAPPILGEEFDTIADPAAPYGDTSLGLEIVSAQYDVGHFSATDLHWNEQPARDPFTPRVVIDADDVDAVQDKVKATVSGKRAAPTKLTLPTVSAVVRSESYRYAIVNGEILSIGDRIANFQVEKMGRASVTFRLLSSNRTFNVVVKE